MRTTRRRSARGTRGTSLLEFVLILPFFLFMTFFVVDVARLLMATTAVQEATYRAARAGATYGGGQPNGERRSETAFRRALAETPGGKSALNPTVQVTSGKVCSKTSPTDSYVTVRSTYTVKFISPGLAGLMSMMSGQVTQWDDQFALTTTSVARCEVAR